MSINLIESEYPSQKSLRGAFASVALHAAVITFAVYATARAGEAIVPAATPVDTIVFYSPLRTEPARTHDTPSHPSDPSLPAPPRGPVIEAPIEIPVGLPPIVSSTAGTPAESLFRSGRFGKSEYPATFATGADSSVPLLASQVDKPAVAREGNPFPEYPSLLERSRVEGSVLVQFVVDTLGNADMSSFRVLHASNELFARSLRTTLAKWRFYAAEAGGRKVKQVVQLPLKFVTPHR